MWKDIDVSLPDGTTHASISLGRGAVALWIVAGLVIALALFLIIDGVLAWRQSRRRLNPGASRIRFTYLRRFLAWLFYPSFQATFKDDE